MNCIGIYMTAKEFIEKELLPTVEYLANKQPYSAFVLMAAGTEFLGKAMRKDARWDDKGSHGKDDFNNAIDKLFPQTNHLYYSSVPLYDKFRCGLLHIVLQKPGLVLHKKGNHRKDNVIL